MRNGVQEKKRSFIVVVGDHSKDVIVHLHYIMSRLDIKNKNRDILWAYKHKLINFTSNRQKREKKIKKEVKRGIREANTDDPFELFITLNNIRYVFYKETENILGNTYGMCVLQDFEAITPNMLARTIETVEGGGLVVLLLKGMSSLKQLSNLTMDVHSRYRTEAHHDVVARFNERFLLSLGKNKACLVLDDEMNVLPISGGKDVTALPPPDLDQPKTEAQIELERIKESLEDIQPLGSLVNLARTVDQAHALQKFVEFITKKTLRSTLTLEAARGRGKSAALGIAVAAAVAHGYSNIFITSPSPENLKTLFEFVFKGFDALGYMDHVDYTIIQSTNPDFNKAVVRVEVKRAAHRQTIQYIRPQDAHVLGNAELLVIDEAAAIPLPLVRKLMGPYLVFMASTINGYEGTGRSLSLKLIKELREKSNQGGRSLEEIKLQEPIRYAKGDAVEAWLNSLLCLDETLPASKLNTLQGCPDVHQCQLLSINRDTLFSSNPVAEKFLQRMVAIYVAAHYKNSPDDLQLMSDAPAHRLFVLVPPISEDSQTLPEPLCVIQVALEGQISKESVLNALRGGRKADGDLIPWVMTEQFRGEDGDAFAGLSGARVVRIATNPNYIKMKYGSRALELLVDFYDGKFTNLSEETDTPKEQSIRRATDKELASASLMDEIKPRDARKMPPLFTKLSDLRPETLDWIGVSYGLTQQLHNFWKRASFAPVYIRQTPNNLTGEYTCVMIRSLKDKGLDSCPRDFKRRFLYLLGYNFKEFSPTLALSVIQSANKASKLEDIENQPKPLDVEELNRLFSPWDLQRLETYARNITEYRFILDLVPSLAILWFTDRLKSAFKLTTVQEFILLAIGLQYKDISQIEIDNLPAAQVLPYLMKMMKKFSSHLEKLVLGAIEADMPAETVGVSRANADHAFDDEVINEGFEPLEQDLKQELEDGGNEAMKELKEKQRQLIDALPLDQYEIEENPSAWAEAEKLVKAGKKQVSVKTGTKRKVPVESVADIYQQEMGDKPHKKSKKGRK